MEKLGAEEGEKLVKLARKTISYYCATGAVYDEKSPEKRFRERKGVFVTINTHPKKNLRGCIGLPYPLKELWSAVIEAAVSAAANDPRFPALSSNELKDVTVEVSVLSTPTRVKKTELPESIKIGKHGIIVERNGQSGLLLPQVATEFNWDKETFLEQTCIKAGLFPGAWKRDEVEVKLFTAQVFAEQEPEGKVKEII